MYVETNHKVCEREVGVRERKEPQFVIKKIVGKIFFISVCCQLQTKQQNHIGSHKMKL